MQGLLAVLLAASGCSDDEGAPPAAPLPTPSSTFAAAPPTSAAAASLQAWKLVSTGDANDAEPSLAVHPTDSSIVLVAWQADIQHIWAALTQDGGMTWEVGELRDPALDGPLADGSLQEGFDPTAAFGPDGTAYVLFGGKASPLPGSAMQGGVTLARRDADSWSFHHVDETGPVARWDAMQLAVSPGSGRLHAVAHTAPGSAAVPMRTFGYWTSDDRGDTWSPLRTPFVEPDGPQEASGDAATVASQRSWYLPRVSAGPDGLVAIAGKSYLNGWPWASISMDDGETFGPPMPVLESGTPDVGLPLAFETSRPAYVASRSEDLAVARWAEGQWSTAAVGLAAPPGLDVDWSCVAAGADALWVLQAFTGAGSSAVRLVQIDAADAAIVLFEEPSSAERPYGQAGGDEYGGIDVAGDGSVWVAWSDPTTEPPTIRVVRWSRA